MGDPGARNGRVVLDEQVTSRLRAENLTLGYDDAAVAEHLSLQIPDGRITVIAGANACGKSTLLRALGRLLRPRTGTVLLDGHDIARLSTKAVARRLGLLPQTPLAPEGITVLDLVSRGRYAHQGLLRRRTDADDEAVVRALLATDTLDLATRPVDQLSGGQRQRVWIAMAIAQDAGIMLLDEPTTFLDLTHQLDVLDILADLNERDGRTVVAVLHDLNQAARYAHHVVTMRHGAIVAQGTPAEVITEENVAAVFDLTCRVIEDPVSGAPLVLPIGRRGRRSDPTETPPRGETP